VLKSYAIKLASEEFIKWVLLEIADAAVQNTKTKYDDKLLEKIKELD